MHRSDRCPRLDAGPERLALEPQQHVLTDTLAERNKVAAQEHSRARRGCIADATGGHPDN
jgi:hypothetical protein